MTDFQQTKKALLDGAFFYIGQRIQIAKTAMEEAQKSANEETKSSAGDKYETGKAMAQIERDKHAAQMAEAIWVKSVLENIDPEKTHDSIILGSVVRTATGNYFVSISAGALEVGGEKYFAVSTAAPIAKSLLGKKAGETVVFDGRQIKVLEVL